MSLEEMVADFCRRTGGRFVAENILKHGRDSLPYVDDDGFFILSIGNDTLFIDYMYIVPGRSKDVFWKYYKMIEAVADQNMLRYVQATARRVGVEKLYPACMVPVAITYEVDRGVDTNGRGKEINHGTAIHAKPNHRAKPAVDTNGEYS